MEGAWRARAEVVVFLDSHIEARSGRFQASFHHFHPF